MTYFLYPPFTSFAASLQLLFWRSGVSGLVTKINSVCTLRTAAAFLVRMATKSHLVVTASRIASLDIDDPSQLQRPHRPFGRNGPDSNDSFTKKQSLLHASWHIIRSSSWALIHECCGNPGIEWDSFTRSFWHQQGRDACDFSDLGAAPRIWDGV